MPVRLYCGAQVAVLRCMWRRSWQITLVRRFPIFWSGWDWARWWEYYLRRNRERKRGSSCRIGLKRDGILRRKRRGNCASAQTIWWSAAKKRLRGTRKQFRRRWKARGTRTGARRRSHKSFRGELFGKIRLTAEAKGRTCKTG